MTRIGKYMAGGGQGQSSLASSASFCLSMARIVLVFSAVGGSYGDVSFNGEDDLHSTLPALLWPLTCLRSNRHRYPHVEDGPCS